MSQCRAEVLEGLRCQLEEHADGYHVWKRGDVSWSRPVWSEVPGHGEPEPDSVAERYDNP